MLYGKQRNSGIDHSMIQLKTATVTAKSNKCYGKNVSVALYMQFLKCKLELNRDARWCQQLPTRADSKRNLDLHSLAVLIKVQLLRGSLSSASDAIGGGKPL